MALPPLQRYLNHALCHMCEKGDSVKVKELVLHGADVNYSQKIESKTPLALAVDSMDLNLVEYLLKCGANTKIIMKQIRCHIGKYTSPAGIKIVQALLKGGAPLESDCSCGSCGHLFLSTVAQNGSCAFLDLLKEYSGIDLVNGSARIKRVKKNDKVYNSCDLWVPILVAARAGKLKVVRQLYAYGADINILDHNRMTPLHHACKTDSREVVNFLIENGADLNVKSVNNETALDLAYMFPTDQALVSHLYKLGARSDKLEQYAVHFNAFIGNVERFEELCSTRVVDMDMKDFTGRTVLHCACYSGNISLVKKCIDRGADVNCVESSYRDNYTPLQIAIAWHYPKLVEFLLEIPSIIINCAESDSASTCSSDFDGDADQWSPLRIAAYVGDLKSTELLLRKGAADPNGEALNTCCTSKHQNRIEIAKKIITIYGYRSVPICTYLPDDEFQQKTELELVVKNDDSELLSALLEMDGLLEILVQNGHVFRALRLACSCNHLDCVKILLKALNGDQRKSVLNAEQAAEILLRTYAEKQPEMLNYLLQEVAECREALPILNESNQFNDMFHFYQTLGHKSFLCLDEMSKVNRTETVRFWSQDLQLSQLYKENIFYFIHFVQKLDRDFKVLRNSGDLVRYILNQHDVDIIQFFSDYGFKMSPNDFDHFRHARTGVKEQEFLLKAQDILSTPPSLMCQCRWTIHDSVADKMLDIQANYSELSLPKSLINFLSTVAYSGFNIMP